MKNFTNSKARDLHCTYLLYYYKNIKLFYRCIFNNLKYYSWYKMISPW